MTNPQGIRTTTNPVKDRAKGTEMRETELIVPTTIKSFDAVASRIHGFMMASTPDGMVPLARLVELEDGSIGVDCGEMTQGDAEAVERLFSA